MAEIGAYINGLAAESSPDTSNDMLLLRDATDGSMKKIPPSAIVTGGGGIDEAGWVASGETWTYASADDPTFTFTISGDLTTKYYPGMRIKLTQTSAKYFIITKVAYGAPNTTVTIYGGTDYDLANAAITDPYYSVTKAPAGFPLDPTKWTVKTTDTADRAQASPVSGTWYNLGSINIVIPIGAWFVGYQVLLDTSETGANNVSQYSTLSTANNSQSDAEFTGISFITAQRDSGANIVRVMQTVHRRKTLVLASKTTYYLNSKAGGSFDTIDFRGDLGTTVIEAVCAYL